MECLRWELGEGLVELTGIAPLLASWESRDDPAQVRLQAYLDSVSASVMPRCGELDTLACELEVDVERPERLVRHYDLENYLTPLLLKLGWSRFVFAKARKRVGGGSALRVGRAHRATSTPSVICIEMSSGATSPVWKSDLRQSLLDLGVAQAPSGPLAVEMYFAVHPSRNWVQLWKPCGDAMGPIVGEPNPRRPYDPDDGRITELSLHRIIDQSRKWEVGIGYAWRPSLL